MYKVIRFFDDLLVVVLALILFLALLIGVYFIWDTAYVYYNASADRVSYYHRPGAAETEAAVETRPFSEDYVAWLSIDDTKIQLPIMQTDNNSKYLNTDPYGDYSLTGSVFLDYRNAPDFSDAYSLTYGHHMSGDYMFGALDRYFDESYFEQHRTGTLTIGEYVYPLQVFAVIRTDAGDESLFLPGDSARALVTARDAALFYREPVSEHLLALTTCEQSSDLARTVVLCAMGEPYME